MGPRTTALTLKRNAAWAFLGQAVSAGCHWGGFIMLGRLAGPEELGRYALALAIANPIILFGGLQMRQLQVADATQHRSFQDYVAVSVAGTTAAGLVLVAIALFGYEWRIALPIMLVGLAQGFENLSDVYYGLAQRHKRLDLVAQSMMLRGLCGLLALGSGSALSGNIAIGLIAMAGAWGLIWLTFNQPVTRRWRPPALRARRMACDRGSSWRGSRHRSASPCCSWF